MALKHLQELLEEDQEPFHLQDFLADRRNQLKRASPKTSLQVKKRNPIYGTPNFAGNLCKSTCLFSFKDTPDIRKSPLFEFSHLSKSPLKSPNRVFLHIPARTSALLLEAAHRIHKQSYSTNSKTQNHGFGLFGSLLKRLTPKYRTQNRETRGEGIKVSEKDVLSWDSSVERAKFSNRRNNMDEKAMVTVECNGRPSSTVWSESNEEKSSDMETSTCSSLSEATQELDFISRHIKSKDCACCGDNAFCESPFRFDLQRSPSRDCRRPTFRSPTMSSIRPRTEEKDGHNGAEGSKKLQKEEDDEEKEQFSPVSVLDTPFEDDYEDCQTFNTECSHEEEEDDETVMYDLQEKDDDIVTPEKEMNLESFSTGPCFLGIQGIPSHMKRLISELINEEEKQVGEALSDMEEEVIERVCKKIELWNDVESNTIDMMVEQNFSTHINIWKNYLDQKNEMANEVELSIISFLMEELSQELASVC